MNGVRLILCCAMLALGGCTHSLTGKGLNDVEKTLAYGELRRNPDAFIGKTVMVGGVVASVHKAAEVTFMEVVQFDLTADLVPNDAEPSGGRFLASSANPAETAAWTPGRLVTIIGEVKGKKVQKGENAAEVFPVLAVREMHAWSTLEPDKTPLLPGHFDPYYWGYPTEQYLDRPIGTKLKRH